MRTWTLKDEAYINSRITKVKEGPTLAQNETVEVIELEPILRALARVRLEALNGEPSHCQQINDLLREHGRLHGDEGD
jgi:hypothetical protein